MRYISTRGNAPVLSFEQAMLTGLARDGGLYLPETIPTLDQDAIAAMRGQSYEDVAFTVMRPFIGDTFTDAEFRAIIARAYEGFGHDARAPLVQLGDNHFLLELFHGPTLAFKDFGQMTTSTASNVHALAVEGDFDTCQAALKDMFNDFEFRDGVRLAGVNSINFARVLAQVVYYFTSAVSLGAPARKVSFTVPTGNFGDIFAGYIAKQMGLPIEKLVIATNQNDILHRCMEEGLYYKLGVVSSISPSMDIEVSSNFERALFYAHGKDGAAISSLMGELAVEDRFRISDNAMHELQRHYVSGTADEEATSSTITNTMYEASNYLLCPHSAVGVKVAKQHLRRDPATPMVTLGTAHPAKFPVAVNEATGIHPPLPDRMADLYDRDETITHVKGDLAAIQDIIRERIST